MREKTDYTIITFGDYHTAIAFECFCQKNEIPGRLIPLPASISAGCGMCWRMRPADAKAAEERIREAGILTEGVFQIMMW